MRGADEAYDAGDPTDALDLRRRRPGPRCACASLRAPAAAELPRLGAGPAGLGRARGGLSGERQTLAARDPCPRLPR